MREGVLGQRTSIGLVSRQGQATITTRNDHLSWGRWDPHSAYELDKSGLSSQVNCEHLKGKDHSHPLTPIVSVYPGLEN